MMQLEVFVTEPGSPTQPDTAKPPGSLVEFNYSLRAPVRENMVLEAGDACKATLRTGALAPELDALLDAVGLHGKARCKVGMHWLCLKKCRSISARVLS